MMKRAQGFLLAVLLLLACSKLTTDPEPANRDTGFTLVQQHAISAATDAPSAEFPSTPQLGNLLLVVLGTVHDDVTEVTPGWVLRVAPTDSTRPPLYVYERIADGTETGISFTLTSADATQIAFFEYAANPPILADAQAQNSTGGRRENETNSISTGTAENVLGTLAFAAIHTSGHDEPIDDWTNEFAELVDFHCCGTLARSRMAIATRGLAGAGAVETSASWTTESAASGAIVTYADGS